jgi:uncharacterized phiE125 gp8 family phage protein
MKWNETSLTLVTDATAYPITKSELKSQLNISETETAFDDYLDSLIVAATEIVELDTQLTLVNKSWKYTIENFPGDEITIPMSPIQSITHIKYYDSTDVLQTVPTAYYTLDGTTGSVNRGNSRIYLNEPYDWPTPYDRRDAVQVTFVGGYGAAAINVPASIRHAIKVLCTFWFEHRGEPMTQPQSTCPAYEYLIARFRRAGYP